MATYKIVASMKRAYEFTGADRTASYTYPDTMPYCEFTAVDRGGVEICFAPNQDLTILNARIISGVPGVVGGDDRPAATITLIFGTQDDCDLDDTLVEVPLYLVEWNRTEKQVKSIGGSVLKASTPVFAFIKGGSSYNVMDFNVQEDWVGEAFTPEIELIIETDHLLTVGGEVLL